jgi:hypothetical protein
MSKKRTSEESTSFNLSPTDNASDRSVSFVLASRWIADDAEAPANPPLQSDERV